METGAGGDSRRHLLNSEEGRLTDGLATRVTDRKYQFMEQNLQRRMAGLKDKLPDIQKTLDTVRFLEMRKVCWTLFFVEADLKVCGIRES